MNWAGRQIALLGNGDLGLACPAELVEAIIDWPRIYRLPGIPEGFAGVCLFRDDPLPVLDLSRLAARIPRARRCLAVCRSEMGPVGVPVATGGCFVAIEDGTIEPEPEPFAPGFAMRFVWRNDSYPLLEIEQLLLHLQP